MGEIVRVRVSLKEVNVAPSFSSSQSLRALNRFATYNSQWIAAAAASPASSAPAHLLIRPWGSAEMPEQDPHDMMNREEENLAKLSNFRLW